jgi:carotenoid cleavage dioxygenase
MAGTAGSRNRYLEGNYGPVREEHTATDLKVTGAIPDYLDGRYLRNGPNPVVDPHPATYHWFMGTGMVHGIRLRDGKAQWYRNRYVRSGDTAAALGEPRRPGPVHAGFDFAANTNVIGHAGRTLAIVEGGGNPYALTDELETVGPCDFDGTLPGGYTAHPLLDPATGELHAVSYFFGWGSKVQYTVVGADGRVRRIVDVPVSGSPMMHAFSLTERYVVIYDLPVSIDLGRAMSAAPRLVARPMKALAERFAGRPVPGPIASLMGKRASSGDFPYTWNPDYPARVGLLPREGAAADVRWFDVEPCYVYHPLNAYDDGADRVVLDVVRHPKTFDTHKLGPGEGPPTLDRWTVDLSAGKVLEERIDDRGQEFPRVDERLTGRRHRYGYSVAVDDRGAFSSTLLRYDMAGGAVATRDFGAGAELGEFVFVPSGPDAAEDDGVLMGLVYDGSAGVSSLAVLDAASLSTVATVELPTRVPHGFHGNWVPAAG